MASSSSPSASSCSRNDIVENKTTSDEDNKLLDLDSGFKEVVSRRASKFNTFSVVVLAIVTCVVNRFLAFEHLAPDTYNSNAR